MTSPSSGGVIGTYPISGDPDIDPLVWLGFKWGGSGAGTSANVSYSFPTSTATWISDYWAQEPFRNFQPFTSAQQTAAKQALALWSEVANISFTQITETASNVGDIRFGNSGAVTNSPAIAWAYTPYDDADFEYPESGDVWFDKAYPPNLQLAPGQLGFWTMLHEIGHAIGLDHPFSDGAGEPVLPANLDTDQYTVMTYTFELSTQAYASTPQVLDILAIQYIYGANMNTRKGNDTYTFSASTEVNRTIWDAGGIDTLNLSNQTTSSVINLAEGSYSQFCRHPAVPGFGPTSSLLGIAYGVTIENANGGSGNDDIFGNAAANRLTGGAGKDELYGYEGDDMLVGGTGGDFLSGGAGNDSYELDSAGDVVQETGSDSNDSVKSSVLVSAISGIENFTYTGAQAWNLSLNDGGANLLSGGSGIDTLSSAGGNDTLRGNAGNDVLTAGAGNDVLDGGLGNDKMRGGSGNDTYTIDAAGDSIDEEGNADTNDLVRSSVTVNLSTLAAGLIEHASLLGVAAINATGNISANKLTGNDAANILDGREGADMLTGGKGADTYVVDNLGDQVVESVGGAAGGIDLVKSSVSFTLGSNLENLTLQGSANVNGTGNSFNNILIGNNGANRLDGGSGNDTMTGGKGNDTYVVNATGDIVNETVLNSSGGGVDTVESSITFSLAARTNIENLTLTGAGNINGTGNTLNNQIIGNTGNNLLDGAAGNDTLIGGGGNDTLNGNTGVDTLKGGGGNDIYTFDNLGDTANEEGNADIADEIKTSVSIASAIAGIENYTFTGAKAWAFTGDAANNRITGGAYNDTLNGVGGNDKLLGNGGIDTLIGGLGDDWLEGGIGNDKMLGGAGNDTYVMDIAIDSINEEGNADTGDLVRSSVTINLTTLAAGLIEHAVLLGATAINATGNAANNSLTGNDGANILDGKSGADMLNGGKGADTYIVDNVTDQVIESVSGAAGGIDLVKSSASFTLGANVENITLTGALNINATGNSLNNVLTGNDGANRLDGGAGNDTMTGGKGNDTYVVNSAGDIVNETILNSSGGGVDTVESSIAFSLAARINIDHLTLTGSSNINGTGNALNNQITGNGGGNTLDGSTGNDTLVGGAGNDTLIGGTGNDLLRGGGGIDNLTGGSERDTFDFDLISEAGDTITDFVRGATGDILNLVDLLDSFGDPLDPFGGGYLAFVQSGTNTLVQVDTSGGMDNVTTLATLTNVTLGQIDTLNYVV